MKKDLYKRIGLASYMSGYLVAVMGGFKYLAEKNLPFAIFVYLAGLVFFFLVGVESDE